MKTIIHSCALVKDGVLRKFECKDDLHSFYSVLGCSSIEIPTRYIGGKPYALMCDEEAWLKDPLPLLSASCLDAREVLLGSILIFNVADKEGNLRGLNDDDYERLGKSFSHGLLSYSVDPKTKTS